MAMKMGTREYTDAEMLRMQRDAEERVREMQARARATVESDNTNGNVNPRNRNWNSNPGRRRQNSNNNNGNNTRHRQDPDFTPPIPPVEPEVPPEPSAQEPVHEAPAEAGKPTTIIEDVMGALGLDEDYLLIIGLLLILLNQRADTTLILALAYLLI